MSAQIVTYRYKLKPTKAQHGRLRVALEHSRQLYNAALEERIDCYRKTGKGRSYFDQTAAMTQLRRSDPSVWAIYAWSMQSAPLKALDLAYKAFFKRGGFPRFKGRDWYKSIAWADECGWAIKAGRFTAKGIGSISVHMHRELPGKPKTARIKREGRHWYLLLNVERDCTAANDNPAIGIDMGLSSLAVMSDGMVVENPRFGRKAHARVRILQRALARAKRGSKNRKRAKERLAAARAAERRQRDTYLHQVSASLARRYGMIAIEALVVKNMVRNGGVAKVGLNRSIQDASWGRLKELLRYKCALNGGRLIEVDPKGTSQLCSGCGVIVPKQLSQRWHDCPDCGLSIDRDHNAALNVLHRAILGPDGLNAAGSGERVHGKEAA